jgi:Cu+-exporting ATPase
MIAAAAMSFSSVSVVLNVLRLGFFGKVSKRRNDLPVTYKKENSMTKTLKIEGMTCNHCSMRVEKALNAIPGVQAKVDLASNTATVTAAEGVSDAKLDAAVEDAGYKVVR